MNDPHLLCTLVLLLTVLCHGRFPIKLQRISHDTAGECGKLDSKTAKRIVGGHKAREWPWMGAIFVIIPMTNPRKGFPYCGCSLIAPKWAMTAAHCVLDEYSNYSLDVFNEYCKKDLIEVMFGETDLHKAKGNTYKLKQAYIMEQYTGTSSAYDVALLELQEPIQTTERIRPVCVDFQGTFDCTPDYCPKDCIAVGWGSKKDVFGPINTNLYEVTRPMVLNEKCIEEWSHVSAQMQCYGSVKGGQGVCSGDSGGPIVCQKEGVWYQVAVISRTLITLNKNKERYECGSKNTFDMHVKTSHQQISSWIRHLTGLSG